MSDQDKVPDSDIDEIRKVAVEAVQKQQATNLNQEYGLSPEMTQEKDGVRAYKPEDINTDSVPLSIDLVQFTLWLRKDTDFFSGPQLDQHHPKWDDPEFTEVLAQNALEYTGE